MNKKLLIALLVIVLAGLGVWKFTSSSEPAASSPAAPPASTPATSTANPQALPPPPTPETQKTEPPRPKTASTEPLPKERTWQCIGSPNAPLKVEVFSDYQCPACRAFYFDVARPLMADYTTAGKVCLIYHEFPLRGHQYARRAAQYAEAAARLGPNQWIRVTDAIFYYQPQWSQDGQLEPVVAKALTEKEMDVVRRLVDDPGIDAAVESGVREGQRRGVRSTPSSFIIAPGREERIPPGVQYPILRRVLDGLLQGQ
ncbi:MAG TPA: thioredoxin domain-containing protein [Candidatus Xenobia bacterium]|nr:thioredoxin domain-containing protein [Candidatus Xenobia bacterium]